MLFTVLQANYFEKISLIVIFSLVNPNAPGLYVSDGKTSQQESQAYDLSDRYGRRFRCTKQKGCTVIFYGCIFDELARNRKSRLYYYGNYVPLVTVTAAETQLAGEKNRIIIH